MKHRSLAINPATMCGTFDALCPSAAPPRKSVSRSADEARLIRPSPRRVRNRNRIALRVGDAERACDLNIDPSLKPWSLSYRPGEGLVTEHTIRKSCVGRLALSCQSAFRLSQSFARVRRANFRPSWNEAEGPHICALVRVTLCCRSVVKGNDAKKQNKERPSR